MKKFTNDEKIDRIDILDKLFYPWYTEKYKHIIDIPNDDLDKLLKINFSDKWQLPITNTVNIYSSTLNLIIQSAVIMKKWQNQDNLRKERKRL